MKNEGYIPRLVVGDLDAGRQLRDEILAETKVEYPLWWAYTSPADYYHLQRRDSEGQLETYRGLENVRLATGLVVQLQFVFDE